MKTNQLIKKQLQNNIKDISASSIEPFYIYDAAEIRANCKKFKDIPYPHKSINFASMANSNSQFLQIIKEEGINIFVNSIMHMEIAQKLGFKGEEIVYTASAMDEETMRKIYSCGALINIDSIGQLKQWTRLFPNRPVGIRCNIGELVEPKKTVGGYYLGKKSRLGFTLDEIEKLKGNPSIIGLHLYAGTNIIDLDYFLNCYKHIINLALDFPKLQYLDFGGGFGIPEEFYEEFDMDLYSKNVTELMNQVSEKIGHQILLILEPGRIIGGRAGYFVCKAIDIKTRGDFQLIGVNASSVQFPRPLFYPDSAFHPVSILHQLPSHANSDELKTFIFGCSTYSRDFLAREVLLPKVSEGDLIILGYAGSYCATAYTHFLGFPQPKEYFR